MTANAKKPLPIRIHDRVYLDGVSKAWKVLEVTGRLAVLRSVTAYPTVQMRDVDVSRLTHTTDLS